MYLKPDGGGGLLWGGLTAGVLIRRYRRFLADVELTGGEVVTAHTANTGAMTACSEPGRRVWLSWHGGRGRKYDYTWEMIEMGGGLVGVNTGVPNRLVREGALAGSVPEFGEVSGVRSEVRVGESRLDLCLIDGVGSETMVEVKNCSLVEDGVGYFPDAVTERGKRHLLELGTVAASGKRAVIFVLVQRGDAEVFRPADHIDAEWGRTLREVVDRGVRLLVYCADLSLDGIRLGRRVPAEL